jgi:Asp-tRNA(Asn)/Glu-tRNA(Gln) amidotransferase A subunit family amidase
MYIDRLRQKNPALKCVISFTEDLAMRQAERADRELAAGDDRGPLHGIPWGVKDILAVPGYRTTWGATPYKDEVRDAQATVVTRLEQAGSVLLAKLAVGALAWGDVWFGGTTKNPWNIEQGSSGSSAGSASATAAGCVGYSIGTETWGSIISPCTRCGATGLRPTHGRVSRAGTMALSWSMDKIGPITRSVEDCALVFGAIQGVDRGDPASVDRPFQWPFDRDPTELRVGYVESMFDEDRTDSAEDDKGKADLREWQEFDRRTLDALRRIGFRLKPVKLPVTYPVSPLALILTAEAAAAFDDLTRSGRDDTLVRQVEQAWPNVFRQGQMIPAVEYIRANRIRTLILRQMETLFEEIDVYVCPSFGGDNLLLTNLTGHPSVVLPNGFRSSDGTPTSITFLGRLFGESGLLAVADRYQKETGFHLRRPPLDG